MSLASYALALRYRVVKQGIWRQDVCEISRALMGTPRRCVPLSVGSIDRMVGLGRSLISLVDAMQLESLASFCADCIDWLSEDSERVRCQP